MKKSKIVVYSVLLMVSLIINSCGSSYSDRSNVVISSSLDSLSYAYGVNLGDSGLEKYLVKIGIIEDTKEIQEQYKRLIAVENDEEGKKELQNELNHKLDSINKINKPKIKSLIDGMRQGLGIGSKDSAYINGISLGQQIAQQMLPQFKKSVFYNNPEKEIDKGRLLVGLRDVLENGKEKISKKESAIYIKEVVSKAKKESHAKLRKELEEKYKDKIAEGKDFLEKNSKKKGVVTLPSGLQYKIIKKGTGKKPDDASKVKVHYHGTLIDGTVFDSSVDRGEKAEFIVSQVIPGWTEALKLMPEGSKWKLYIPSNLAYGSKKSGKIEPFSTLIFDVELFSVKN